MAAVTHDITHRELGIVFADALSGADGANARAAEPPLMNDAFDPPAIPQDEYRGHLDRLALVDPAFRMIEPNIAAETNIQNMTGTVTVALVFVESNGGIDPDVYTWTDADEAATVAGAAAGLAWWAEQAMNRGVELSFRVVVIPHTDARAQQGYEPILHSSTEESIWIRAIMENMGFAGSPYAAVAAFNTALRVRHHSDRAYTAFFSYNPAPAPSQFVNGYAAWAFLGGPYTSLLFRSFGWSTKQVFTHETGHIFRACDEYYSEGYGGCRNCGPCAQGSENGNCQFCNPESVPCMMRLNESEVCSFTAQQLGWPTGPSECFHIHNDGTQTLAIESIEAPAWMEITPSPPIAVPGGASKQVCAKAHCGSCKDGPLAGSIVLFGNDPDDNPEISVWADCTCSLAQLSCRCTGGAFHCTAQFADETFDGKVVTLEVDGQPQSQRVNKRIAAFSGTLDEGSHIVLLADPACAGVSSEFSCPAR